MNAPTPKQTAVRFENVSIVFGDDPASALPLMDENLSRPDIHGLALIERLSILCGDKHCAHALRPGSWRRGTRVMFTDQDL